MEKKNKILIICLVLVFLVIGILAGMYIPKLFEKKVNNEVVDNQTTQVEYVVRLSDEKFEEKKSSYKNNIRSTAYENSKIIIYEGVGMQAGDVYYVVDKTSNELLNVGVVTAYYIDGDDVYLFSYTSTGGEGLGAGGLKLFNMTTNTLITNYKYWNGVRFDGDLNSFKINDYSSAAGGRDTYATIWNIDLQKKGLVSENLRFSSIFDEGTIFTAIDNKIVTLDTKGNILHTTKAYDKILSMDGIYVSDEGKVKKIDPSGKYIATYGNDNNYSSCYSSNEVEYWEVVCDDDTIYKKMY